MHAHFVLAHPEPRSFNACRVGSGVAALGEVGWTASVSAPYAAGFDPCERREHYPLRAVSDRFDAQAEQRHASEAGRLPQEVAREIALMEQADLLVLQYPMWQHLPPAMLKGWLDRMLAYGDVYTSAKRFEHGRFAGKRAMLSVTVGTSAETYAHDGRRRPHPSGSAGPFAVHAPQAAPRPRMTGAVRSGKPRCCMRRKHLPDSGT